MELNEQEAHCVARHMQALMYGRDISDACTFCKFPCCNKGEPPMQEYIKERLTEETGVDVRTWTNWDMLPELGDFPYKKFLINANEGVIRYYRERWDYNAL